jgi:hypothetical protein
MEEIRRTERAILRASLSSPISRKEAIYTNRARKEPLPALRGSLEALK